MTVEEASKIIAEFMGIENTKHHTAPRWDTSSISFTTGEDISKFSNSLDALVPVWEKLDRNCIIDHSFKMKNQSIQEAAAVATAKTIQAIKGGE